MSRRKSHSESTATEFVERVSESLNVLGAVGQRVVAAVSGGSDSTALLVAMNSLRRKAKLDLAAVHANHALRGEESEADECFVRDLCERLKVPLVCRRLAVPLQATKRDEGIEVTARNLRQQFFGEAARELGAAFVAAAHTADDQAETVLHRIVRGTGLAGLVGIPASRELVPGVTIIHPLLHLRRTDVLEYLAAAGQDFREDRSNRDLTFTRNRVRHELLPYLAKNFNPQVSEALTRLAGIAAEAQASMARQIDQLARRAVIKQDARRVTLRVAVLRRTPAFQVCELLRQLWTQQGWSLQEIGQAELERIAKLANGEGKAWDLPGGVQARRAKDRLLLVRVE